MLIIANPIMNKNYFDDNVQYFLGNLEKKKKKNLCPIFIKNKTID